MKAAPKKLKWYQKLFDFILRRKRNCREFVGQKEIWWDSHGKKTVFNFGAPMRVATTAPVATNEEEDFDPALCAVNPLSDAAGSHAPGVAFVKSRGVKIEQNKP